MRLWTIPVVVGAGLLAMAATPVWQKDFTAWTDQDVRVLMTDSPWAKQMPLPVSGRPNVTYADPTANAGTPGMASLGNPANTTTPGNMSPSGNAANASPGEANNTGHVPTTHSPTGPIQPTAAPEQEPLVTVIWASATPIRLAVLKIRSGTSSPTDDQIASTKKPRPNYVIAVSGLPTPDSAADPKELAQHAVLSEKGKPPLRANESLYRQIGNADVYFFHFTRSALPLTESDGEIEFRVTVGKIDIRKKFDLKAMHYQGQLAL
jgi:hypothetical protein